MKHDKYFHDYKHRVLASKSKYNQGNLSHNIGKLLSIIYQFEAQTAHETAISANIKTSKDYEEIKKADATITWENYCNAIGDCSKIPSVDYENAINIINKQIGIMR